MALVEIIGKLRMVLDFVVLQNGANEKLSGEWGLCMQFCIYRYVGKERK